MAIFATVHSGLASLRDQGEKLIGERAFRVLFAGISLPLSVSTIVSTYYLQSFPTCSIIPFLLFFVIF
jgi:NnrU protein